MSEDNQRFYTVYMQGSGWSLQPVADIRSTSAKQALDDFVDLYGGNYGTVVVMPMLRSGNAAFEEA